MKLHFYLYSPDPREDSWCRRSNVLDSKIFGSTTRAFDESTQWIPPDSIWLEALSNKKILRSIMYFIRNAPTTTHYEMDLKTLFQRMHFRFEISGGSVGGEQSVDWSWSPSLIACDSWCNCRRTGSWTGRRTIVRTSNFEETRSFKSKYANRGIHKIHNMIFRKPNLGIDFSWRVSQFM